MLSDRGKVIAWTRREWVLPLEEIALTTVTWVNDDGTVVRRALTPEDMPEKILERGADEGRILGFGEYGVPAGPGRLMNMAGWDYDGELTQENDNAEEEGWEIDESEWIGWVKWEECTGGDFRDLQV
jgi:hypothetical protein